MKEFMTLIISKEFTLVIVVFIIITAAWKKDKDLVTMFGILGTFLGIVGGLYFFDTNNIDEGIPKLIDGLKTAFYTSIAGLIASITLNFIEKKEESKDEIGLLRDLLTEIKGGTYSNNSGLILEELKSLNKNIGGDGDTSLLSQIQKLRTVFSDKQDELKKSFDEFSKQMAENNMKALIEAIQKVMEDFNSKINDQLGQSFKELTRGIDSLLVWQNEYRENIISSTESLNLSKESLDKSSKGFEITVEKSELFSGIAENLGNELKTLNSSLEIFKLGINEFEKVSINTKEMADSMIKSIDGLTDNFVKKAEIMIQESSEHIKNMKSSFSEQSVDLRTTHKNILEELKQELENNNKISSEQFLKMQGRLEEQVLEFDKKLGEELEKSLKTLGQQLTGLSGKFVSDYGNLAEKLERLVNLSK